MHCLEGSPDSFIKIQQIVDQAKQMGLDAICITDHDNNDVRDYALKYSKDIGFKIFVGVEILTYEGDIVVFGLQNVPTQKIHAQELIDLVHEVGGVTIAAHPFRENNRGCGKYLKELKGLTAVEVFNGSTKSYNNLYAFATALELGLATVAASDCHEVETVGRYCTIFPDDVETEEDLICAIREGKVYPAVYREGAYVKIDAYGKYGEWR